MVSQWAAAIGNPVFGADLPSACGDERARQAGALLHSTALHRRGRRGLSAHHVFGT